METNIQIFTSEIFGEIRTCQVNNQIMFVGKDVATALGYAKPQNALATHVDREDKSTAPIQGTAYETRVFTLEDAKRVRRQAGLDTRRTSHMVSNWKLRKYISQISDLSFQKLKYTSPCAGRKS